MPVMTEPKLISGNANMPLAAAIARRMSMHRGMNVSLCDARTKLARVLFAVQRVERLELPFGSAHWSARGAA